MKLVEFKAEACVDSAGVWLPKKMLKQRLGGGKVPLSRHPHPSRALYTNALWNQGGQAIQNTGMQSQGRISLHTIW